MPEQKELLEEWLRESDAAAAPKGPPLERKDRNEGMSQWQQTRKRAWWEGVVAAPKGGKERDR